MKSWVLKNRYDYLFELFIFIMSHPDCSKGFETSLTAYFEEARLAYRINDSTIYPAASEEEGEAIRAAFAATAEHEYGGARGHLQTAADALSTGDGAGGVRESIHAVESAAKCIEPSASTLLDALKRLSSAGRLNPNLKRGMEARYNYTSNEQEIRHAMVLDAEVNVSRADAVFMFGACASFVTYLIESIPKK